MSNAFGQFAIKANGLNTVSFLCNILITTTTEERSDNIEKEEEKLPISRDSIVNRVNVFCGATINLDICFRFAVFFHHSIGQFTIRKQLVIYDTR